MILLVVVVVAILYGLFFKCKKEGFHPTVADSAHARAGVCDDNYCCPCGCPLDLVPGYLKGDYRAYLHHNKCGM